MLDLHQCIFDSLFLLWGLDRSFLDSLFLMWDLDRCHFDPLLLLLAGLSPLHVLICFPIGGTGDWLGDLEKLSSFDKYDKSDDMFLDRSRNLLGPLLLLSDGLSLLHVLFFSRGSTGDGLGDLEKLSSDDESGEKSFDQFRDLLGLLLLLLDSLSLLYLLRWWWIYCYVSLWI